MLILAAVYQVTPLKTYCLTKCRSPIGFIMTSWRPRPGGAFHMGLRHGLLCLGCCWLLFVILFPLGMMNISTMAILSLLIFAEKSAAWSKWAVQASAVGLAVYGLAVLIEPSLLPTYMNM